MRLRDAPNAAPAGAHASAPAPVSVRTSEGAGVERSTSAWAARGAAWLGGSAVLAKALAAAAQVALGWLLAPDDFAVYALAISLGVLVVVLRNGGTLRVLIQQGTRLAELARPVARIALGFNLIAASGLLAVAPAAADFYDEPRLVPLVALVALSLPLSGYAGVHHARLSIALRFQVAAKVDLASVAFKQVLTVGLALAGAGVYSFVLPLVAGSLFDWLLLRAVAGELPRSRRRTVEVFREIFPAARWSMVSLPATTLYMQGDYLVVGRLQPSVLGAYFFGFQLTASLAQVIAQAVMRVMLPALVRLEGSPERQAAGYIQAVQYLLFFSATAGAGFALVAEPLVHLVWAGKWNDAVPAAQMFALALPFLLLNPLAVSTLEARGRWRALSWLLWLHAGSTLLAAAIGSGAGTVAGVAAWVAGQHAVNGVVQYVLAGRALGVTLGQLLTVLLRSAAPVALAASLTLLAIAQWTDRVGPASQITLAVATYLLLSMASCWVFGVTACRQLGQHPFRPNSGHR
jgi:O-antigen/teichoic acid export membrane protein